MSTVRHERTESERGNGREPEKAQKRNAQGAPPPPPRGPSLAIIGEMQRAREVMGRLVKVASPLEPFASTPYPFPPSRTSRAIQELYDDLAKACLLLQRTARPTVQKEPAHV